MMSVEWLLLLLPVAAYSGWVAASRHYTKKSQQQNVINPAYFKGLNYLLNEQPDKAIDVFIKLLEVNSDTVETHMALANLFRRRGETERAIRIHQNLIARPSLTQSQRDQALVELGLDYMKAGVLDRAESLFLELLNKPATPYQAYKQLLHIYQQEKNWQRAIDMAAAIQTQYHQKMNDVIAQFYCELATDKSNNDSSSSEWLKLAHKHDANCVRATMLQADMLIDSGEYRKALKTLLQVEQQNPDYLPEVLNNLLLCHQKLNSLGQFEKWLTQVLKQHPNMTRVRLMLTKVMHLHNGSKAAHDYLVAQLPNHPSVEGLHALLRLGEATNPVLVPLIKDLTSLMIKRGDRYSCKSCGFAGRTMHWHCPGCKAWGTVKPTEIHLSAVEHLLESSK